MPETKAFSLPVNPGSDGIEPTGHEVEPTIGAYRLAAEGENEVAERTMRNGKTHIQEEYMGVIVFPCPVDGMPNGHHVRVEMGVTLAA